MTEHWFGGELLIVVVHGLRVVNLGQEEEVEAEKLEV